MTWWHWRWPAISSPSPCRSTHHPPHEQLLVGLGVVGVSSISMGGHGGALALIFGVVAGFRRIWVHSDSTYIPPYEQGLVGMGAGAGLAVMVG